MFDLPKHQSPTTDNNISLLIDKESSTPKLSRLVCLIIWRGGWDTSLVTLQILCEHPLASAGGPTLARYLGASHIRQTLRGSGQQSHRTCVAVPLHNPHLLFPLTAVAER